jgi:hypothetical protein
MYTLPIQVGDDYFGGAAITGGNKVAVGARTMPPRR